MCARIIINKVQFSRVHDDIHTHCRPGGAAGGMMTSLHASRVWSCIITMGVVLSTDYSNDKISYYGNANSDLMVLITDR